MVAWNPLGQPASPWMRLPVTGSNWTVTAMADGSSVSAETVVIDQRTLEIPLLYLNEFNMNATQIAAARKEMANNATHILVFRPSLPAFGHATFRFVQTDVVATVANSPRRRIATTGTVSNGVYAVSYDTAKGAVTAITNIKSNMTTPFSIDWGFYKYVFLFDVRREVSRLPTELVLIAGQLTSSCCFGFHPV